MLLMGIDLGTSSVKISIVDAATQQCIASAHYPETEADIQSPQPGWAEQSPEEWWQQVQLAILKCHALQRYDPQDIKAIGIAYQMHGLVLVDKDQQVLRNAIIWCDSRAVEIGNKAFKQLGEKRCLSHLLNSPGNFTASKLAWVKKHEPEVYDKIDKIMLPGDFIAMKLTGEITTSIAALSEGIFWDFKQEQLSEDVINYFGFHKSFFPDIYDVFAPHGYIKQDVAARLSLSAGIPVAYKAGDQPNNALSLNVIKPGEVAATAGTSGVIYGVTDSLFYDRHSRINSFAHVNHTSKQKSIGVLLCINGAGILNRWVKNNFNAAGYEVINSKARQIAAGSEGVIVSPFGNGAERMLENKIPGAHILNIDLNKHNQAHLFRAAQEGIAMAFRYGLDIMRKNGMNPKVIRAGRANLFLSDIFIEAFVNVTNVPVELHNCDGSVGAAIGAGIGSGTYASFSDAFSQQHPIKLIKPTQTKLYNQLYDNWRQAIL